MVDGELEIDTSVFTNAEPNAAQILVSDSYIFRETLGGRINPIALDPVILGDSPSQVALRKRAEKTRFVEIGVTDPHGEIFGATALKVHWELGSEVEEAGFDADWARASVMYDFASGKAWKAPWCRRRCGSWVRCCSSNLASASNWRAA